MMAISLSGTDSHRSSDGAIQSLHGSTNEKNRWESPIAMTFSAFQISSISTKADCQRRARTRELCKIRLVTKRRRRDRAYFFGSYRLPIRHPHHVGSDPKSAGTVAWRLDVG